MSYVPNNWIWFVTQTQKYWQTTPTSGAYVDASTIQPQITANAFTTIDTEINLASVLRSAGYITLAPHGGLIAQDVTDEYNRRVLAQYGNLNVRVSIVMNAILLLGTVALGGTLTTAQKTQITNVSGIVNWELAMYNECASLRATQANFVNAYNNASWPVLGAAFVTYLANFQ